MSLNGRNIIDLDRDATVSHKDKLKAVVTARLISPVADVMSRSVSKVYLYTVVVYLWVLIHMSFIDRLLTQLSLRPACKTLVGTHPQRKVTQSSAKRLDLCMRVMMRMGAVIHHHRPAPPAERREGSKRQKMTLCHFQTLFHSQSTIAQMLKAVLNHKKMTKETRSSFLSSIASAMLTYKRYPTRDGYICVARTVIKEYQFMASPTGTPYVSEFYTFYM